MIPRGLCTLLIGFAFYPAFGHCEPLAAAGVKHESFDHDPGWEGHNNLIVPAKVRMVTQDFGYRSTNAGGKEVDEIGGTVTRASVPAFFARKIPAKTLGDKMSASGSFALTQTHSSSGFCFGWFNSRQPGGSRPISSLTLQVDGENRGARLAVRMITGQNKSCGTFITPFSPGRYRPTPIKNDGTRYNWKLSYDPGSTDGKGHFEFSIRSNARQHEDFEGKVFSVEVPKDFKNQETVFDRFGLMNEGRAGGVATVYFTLGNYDGRPFTHSAGDESLWEGSGNHRTYSPEDAGGAHHYGFSGQTSFAGGMPGEMGGVLWRTEKSPGWYADRTGPLTLDGKLEASGKVMLVIGAPDSGACIGWFNSATSRNSPVNTTNFLGVAITGPTRVGHYFAPAYATAKGHRNARKTTGPVLVPGKAYRWKLVYDPAANGGDGAMQVTLGDESVTLNLKQGDKEEGAHFDRFGLGSIPPGGGMVKIYFDDLNYSAGLSSP